MSPTAGDPPLLGPGDELAPGYTVVAHLRRGNDLDVYDAWSADRACRCVVKALRPDRREHEPARRRLRSEGRFLLGLNHPHIVRAYDLVSRPDPVVALEVLQGETVGHLLTGRRRRLGVGEIAHLGLHLCSAMRYMHANGILHIDLKPSNVIAEFGQAKVIDLSLARAPGRAKKGVGTRQYLAPEQATGGRLTAAADVWGIGVVLYEATTGRQAFPEGVANALDRPSGEWPASGPARALRRAPKGFTSLIEGSLEPEAVDRPTLGELSTGLRTCIVQSG